MWSINWSEPVKRHAREQDIARIGVSTGVTMNAQVLLQVNTVNIGSMLFFERFGCQAPDTEAIVPAKLSATEEKIVIHVKQKQDSNSGIPKSILHLSHPYYSSMNGIVSCFVWLAQKVA